MKKAVKIITTVIAIFLILGPLEVNAFVGNPVSRYLVDRNSDIYIEEHYSDLDLVKEIGFEVTKNRYYVKLKSETIKDLYFTLDYSLTGQLINDLYENNITEGWNVIMRLQEDYRNETDIIFEALKDNPLFKETDSFFTSAYLMNKIDDEHMPAVFEDRSGGIDGTTLELDKEYDLEQMGAMGGVIDIAVQFLDGDESYEHGAKVLQEIKTTLDEANIGFYYINLAIFNEEGNYAYRFDFFPYSEIDSDNLIEKINASISTTQKYYDEINARTLKVKED
ncbi:MAG: hypothetical protein ATN31_11425 [Candidatus Epulonipiscioides saccharophilum]|nr:MAG: hypothetical protein ATN31_11425 [Epulopiscium sp. AS2M-Bin001]